MSDYRKYLLRQMGLKEAQFVPFVREDEHPDIDPEVLMQKKKKEMGEHPHLSAHDAELVAKQHMKKGVDEQGPMMSPTAVPTSIIGVAIRGSYTGGLPSGADKTTPDLAPNKLGGYDRVEPEMLNSKLIDKTPKNPEIGQESQPIINNPSTGQGVTHPHQMQVTAGEEPQATTGASTDSDPTLKLKSSIPKGIDIDIADETPSHEEENPMIPTTSLSEVFEKHKKLMYEKIGACSCGHMKKECDCKPDCKCGCNKKVGECSTCGCGDPNNKHGMAEEVPAPGQSDHVYAMDRFMNSPEGKFNKEMYKQTNEPLAMSVMKQLSGEKPKYIPPSGGAGLNETDKPQDDKKKSGFIVSKKKYFDPKTKTVKDVDWISKKKDEKGAVNESYTAPFQRMRAMAGIGPVILGKDGQWVDTTITEEKHEPGAAHPFNTHWKMDKEKAGFVKIDKAKLNHIKAQLEKKSERGTLSDKELLLTKRIGEVLKRRQVNEGKDDTEGKCCECGKDLPDNYDSDTCPKCKAKLRPDRLSGFVENKEDVWI